MKRKSKGGIIFDVVLTCFMLVLVFVTIYPLWYVLVASFSSAEAVTTGKVIFWVKDFCTDAYAQAFRTKNLITAYENTIFYSVVGTFLSISMTCLGGYVTSKKRLAGRNIFITIIMITMWFSAGTMPTYLNIRNLGLMNTRTGILLLGAVSAFYLILMRTFFEGVPDAMEESAKIDGASDFTIFLKIYLPLSGAAIVTIILYYFVDRWNGYFWSMILLKDESKIPLQVLLKKLVVEMNATYTESSSYDYTTTSRETMIFATIMVSTLPIVAIYPFIQRFFVKGVTVGAVKG